MPEPALTLSSVSSSSLLSSARLVRRRNVINGLQYSFARSTAVTFVPERQSDLALLTVPVLDSKNREVVNQSLPGLLKAIDGAEFAAVAEWKLDAIKSFWAKRGEPVLNERMLRATALVLGDDGVQILYDDTSPYRFNDLLALRQHVADFMPADPASVFEALGEVTTNLNDGRTALLPIIKGMSVGANAVRLVRTRDLDVPVAIFTLSGGLTIEGSAVEDAPAPELAVTGGAVCPDKEAASIFDVLDCAEREMVEETAIGLAGGKATNIGFLVQDDGQLAVTQVHDLRTVDEAAFRDTLVGADPVILEAYETFGPTFEFFAAIRRLAPDAAEAQRYVAVPLTVECFEFLLCHPTLGQRSWTTNMLIQLADWCFGVEATDRIVATMADTESADACFASLAATAALAALQRQLYVTVS